MHLPFWERLRASFTKYHHIVIDWFDSISAHKITIKYSIYKVFANSCLPHQTELDYIKAHISIQPIFEMDTDSSVHQKISNVLSYKKTSCISKIEIPNAYHSKENQISTIAFATYQRGRLHYPEIKDYKDRGCHQRKGRKCSDYDKCLFAKGHQKSYHDAIVTIANLVVFLEFNCNEAESSEVKAIITILKGVGMFLLKTDFWSYAEKNRPKSPRSFTPLFTNYSCSWRPSLMWQETGHISAWLKMAGLCHYPFCTVPSVYMIGL